MDIETKEAVGTDGKLRMPIQKKETIIDNSVNPDDLGKVTGKNRESQAFEEKVDKKESNFLEDGTYKINTGNKKESDAVIDAEKVPDNGTLDETPVLEEIIDEVKEDGKEDVVKESTVIEDKVEEIAEVVKEAVEEKAVLPENVEKLVSFMTETGGSLEDFVRLNTDYSQLSEAALLKDYLKTENPDLDAEEIDFLIEDKYSFDEDLDEDRDIKRKKIAYKGALREAKKHFDGLKDKYYDEVKLTSKLSPEIQDKIKAYDEFQAESKESLSKAQLQGDAFKQESGKVFDENFKGFEYSVGDKKYRFNVKDVKTVSETQGDMKNVFGKYIGEDNIIKDAKGYHKALFAANNSDAIATHFYEQGKADAIKQQAMSDKNIKMNPRSTGSQDLVVGKRKFKAVRGEDSSKLRMKLRT